MNGKKNIRVSGTGTHKFLSLGVRGYIWKIDRADPDAPPSVLELLRNAGVEAGGGVRRGRGGEEAAHQAQRFRTVASEAKEEGKGGVGRGPTFLEECGESVGSAEAV